MSDALPNCAVDCVHLCQRSTYGVCQRPSNRQDELMALADEMAANYLRSSSPRSDVTDDVAYRRSRDALQTALASLMRGAGSHKEEA
jgi:hypothetical protein